MKKTWMKRLGGFMAEKGFYIALFLCIAAVGISGYILFSTLNRQGPALPASGRAQVVVNSTPSPVIPTKSPTRTEPVKPTVPAGTPSPTPTPSEPGESTVLSLPGRTEPTKPEITPAPAPAPTPTKPVATVYTWPVKGEILHPYSPDLPIVSVTMGDRRVHDGIDISCELGSQVKAVGSGTVTAVEEDYFKGVMVTIDHGNGVESVYYNLAGQPVVEAGDTVSVGDVIGAVGNTAKLELSEPAHLHFAMYSGGVTVDPEEYLPEMK